MKVLFLPYYWRNPYQAELGSALRRLGAQVHFGYMPSEGGLDAALAEHGTPDLLHLHWTQQLFLADSRASSKQKAETFLVRLSRLREERGTPVVWTVHNLGDHNGRFADLERILHRRLSRACDALIAHCGTARDMIIQAYELTGSDTPDVHVVPHGSYRGAYPDDMDRAEARRRLGLPETVRTFLYFGHIKPYKGIAALLEAFSQLENPDARLVLAGQVHAEPVAREVLQAAGRDHRILFRPGFVEDADVQMYFKSADALVTPFESILTSGSAVLGLSFGLPVVAPRLGCLSDLLGADGHLLYDPAEADGLVAALRRVGVLVRGPDHEARPSPAPSWSTVAEQTMAVYRSVGGGA